MAAGLSDLMHWAGKLSRSKERVLEGSEKAHPGLPDQSQADQFESKGERMDNRQY